ncbi:hypothetical protein GCM10027058_25540 [Microbacterium neimengense]
MGTQCRRPREQKHIEVGRHRVVRRSTDRGMRIEHSEQHEHRGRAICRGRGREFSDPETLRVPRECCEFGSRPARPAQSSHVADRVATQFSARVEPGMEPSAYSSFATSCNAVSATRWVVGP